jgi:hypothetical protein
MIGVNGVRDHEVEVGREAALFAEDELADRGPALEDDRVVLEQALQSQPVEEVLLGELQVGLVPAPAAVDGRELIDRRAESPGRHPQAIIDAQDGVANNHCGPRRPDPGACAPRERLDDCRGHVRGTEAACEIRHPGCPRMPDAAGHRRRLLGTRDFERPAQPVVGVAKVTACRRPQRRVGEEVRGIRYRDVAEIGDARKPGPGRLDHVVRSGEGDGTALIIADRPSRRRR